MGRGDKQRKQRCTERETGRVGREGLELETTGVVAPGPGEGPCTVGARVELGSSGFRARVTVGASLWSRGAAPPREQVGIEGWPASHLAEVQRPGIHGSGLRMGLTSPRSGEGMGGNESPVRVSREEDRQVLSRHRIPARNSKGPQFYIWSRPPGHDGGVFVTLGG